MHDPMNVKYCWCNILVVYMDGCVLALLGLWFTVLTDGTLKRF